MKRPRAGKGSVLFSFLSDVEMQQAPRQRCLFGYGNDLKRKALLKNSVHCEMLPCNLLTH